MLISVIVPVYNVENYLRHCVQSITSQAYKKLEVLLVDDGSTDRSGQICDELALQDSRIRVFHKENGGVSSARNLGIENASGDYICFVDSDDWLDTDYFDKAVPVLKKERPVLLMNNYVRDDGKGHVSCEFPCSSILRFSAAEAFWEMANGSHLGWEPFASFYEAIGCKKVRFDSRVVFGEDLLFRFQFTQENDGLYVYQYLPAYHYFSRMNSAVNSYAVYKKADDLAVLEQIMEETNERTRRLLFCKQYVPRLAYRCVMGYQSDDSRDLAVADKLRGMIWHSLLQFYWDDALSTFLKLQLTICLLPKFMIRILWRMYRILKKH